MKFQDSKPEIKAPESKTYILHCKMYVFGRSAVGRQDFDVFFLKLIFGDFRENIHFTV